jgi:hypothetical protein
VRKSYKTDKKYSAALKKLAEKTAAELEAGVSITL